MNSKLLIALAFSLIASVALDGPVRADSPPASFSFVGTHYEGQVQEINAQTMTASITTRFGERTLPVKATADTRIWITRPMAIKNLKIGDPILVYGRENKDRTEIAALLVDVLPGLPATSTNTTRPQRQSVYFGTIATIGNLDAPAKDITFTVTDRDGKSVTITDAGKMHAGQTVAASFDDIDPGANIKVDGKSDGSVFEASRIIVQISGRGGKKGKIKPNKPAITAPAPAPAPAASTAPTTDPAAPAVPVVPAKAFQDDDFSADDVV